MFVPIVCRQINEKRVKAYVCHYNKYLENIKNQIETCLKNAALEGAVIGIIESDIQKALSIFQFAFDKCLQQNIKAKLTCIIAGIYVFTDEGPWKQFDGAHWIDL